MTTQTKPRTRKMTIIAQDPSLRVNGKILTAEIEIPSEDIGRGPKGYRVHVVDYDTTTGTLYMPRKYEPQFGEPYPDPYKKIIDEDGVESLLQDPQFHQQNVYAIVMRILTCFEQALGRRIPWGFAGHQLYVAPHAFADPNAFYSKQDQSLMFGYFKATEARFKITKQSLLILKTEGVPNIVVKKLAGIKDREIKDEDEFLVLLKAKLGIRQASTYQSQILKHCQNDEVIFSCLSHDVVAHETTHAILDGLRHRYTDPSSPDQAGFHEGFADVVALLSVFSLPVVASLLPKAGTNTSSKVPPLIAASALTENKLRKSILVGLAEQMGAGINGNAKEALRNSLKILPLTDTEPSNKYLNQDEFQEPHRRGELLVASMMTAFLKIWLQRIEQLKAGGRENLDRQLVVLAGANTARHLLTIAIRAIDYAPPTDIQFSDYLSALLTSDQDTVPDDSQYGYRKEILDSFKSYGIFPSPKAGADGTWEMMDDSQLIYDRTHLQSLMNEPDEVFHFLWENRHIIGLNLEARTIIQSVRPCLRVGPDGFFLRETVAEYIQLMTLRAEELEDLNINIPEGMLPDQEVTLYGGGALVFNEFGRLKYHICNRILDDAHQTPRLKYLWEYGYFNQQRFTENLFARIHLQRALSISAHTDEEF